MLNKKQMAEGTASEKLNKNMNEAIAQYYSATMSEKIKKGIKISKEKQAERLEKLKAKKVRRLDVLAQLNVAERSIIFENMGIDFKDGNDKVLAYQNELKESVNKLFV
jgi:hypothetical protein